jgi:drug/metabolite transporter (DMT)-like permease
MSTPLSLAQIAILALYAAGMAAGQMLFKMAALNVPRDRPILERVLDLAQSWAFLAALVFYFALSIFWVSILTYIPLSRAYPFLALGFAITPILGGVLFSEPLTLRLVIGIAVILSGLLLVAR